MSLVFAGICSHGPGITARTERADPARRGRYFDALATLRTELEASRPDALIVIAAEHFANFFMNNMPAFAIGMAEHYEGPIEDPDWLRIPRRRVPGAKELSRRLLDGLLPRIDMAYCEEWQFDHGIMVPLHFLTPGYALPVIPVNINCQCPPMTPLPRAYAMGQALRTACDAQPERIAIIGTGGISHWPCTPDTGKINTAWDQDFLQRWARNEPAALTAYTDAEVYRDGGQGGFEIRTLIAVAGAASGLGEVRCYEPIPEYACGVTVGRMALA